MSAILRALAACGRSLKGRVTAKRGRILGGDDAAMLIHWKESATTKTAPFRRNPSGAGGFGPQALSLVGRDEKTSPAPHFAPATRRPLRAALETSATGCWAVVVDTHSRRRTTVKDSIKFFRLRDSQLRAGCGRCNRLCSNNRRSRLR